MNSKDRTLSQWESNEQLNAEKSLYKPLSLIYGEQGNISSNF